MPALHAIEKNSYHAIQQRLVLRDIGWPLQRRRREQEVSEAAFAQVLAEVRNRIRVRKSAVGGPERFRPAPYRQPRNPTGQDSSRSLAQEDPVLGAGFSACVDNVRPLVDMAQAGADHRSWSRLETR